MKKTLAIFLSLLGVTLFSGFLALKSEPGEKILKEIPVQSGGRVKPFESFAREALLSVTGKFSWEGRGATAVLWEWISRPEAWYTKSFLTVKYAPLQKELSLMVIGGKISPELVLSHAPFQAKVREAAMKREKKLPLTPLERKRIELYERARLFQAVAEGALPGFLPPPEDPRGGWIPLAGLADPETRIVLEKGYPLPERVQFQEALARLVSAWRGEADLFQAAQAFQQSREALLKSRGISLNPLKIQAELVYNQIRPFQWAWIFYLASGLLWFFLRNRLSLLPVGFFAGGFAFHTAGFFLRCLIAGRPPVSNMYESVIWVAWAAALFSLFLYFFYRNAVPAASAAWVASFALLVGESFPAVLDPSLSPLVPVLRNNYWLTVHVLTITLSYGAFALAWGLAHANLWSFAFRPEKREEQNRLAEYVYRALQIGVVLLAAGTILGGVWANDSWGRFWGWDPKETWALIALLGYMMVLHGRSAGWLGDFGTALGSVVAFLGVLMAWYGVNFVLGAGLHSYGFGGGGLPYVLAAVGLDLVFVSFLTFRYNKFRSRSFIV